MYCKTCGLPVPDTARFCGNCGTKVESHAYRKPLSAPPVPSASPSPRRTSRNGAMTFGLSLFLIVLVVVFEIIGYAIAGLTGLDADLMITLFGALGAVLSIIILGGISLLRPNASKLLRAWKEGWWCIAVSVGLSGYDIVMTLASGETLVTEGWLLRTLGVLLLCLAVGASEEAVFRGLVLNGALDAFGKKKIGIVLVSVIVSIGFGAAHVVWGDLDYSDPLSILQAVLKTIQTGTYGFFLAALTIRTGDLVGPMLLHAFDDFFLMLPSVGLYGETVTTEYVHSGEDAIPTIMLYVIIILLYLPLVWRGVKLLIETTAPQRGAFHKEATDLQAKTA